MTYKYMLGLLGAALITATVPVQSKTYLATFHGTMISGTDVTGEFVSAGADLTGLAFTSVFTITDPLAGALYLNDGQQAYILGGNPFASVAPVSGVLTINGKSRFFGGPASNHSEAYRANDTSSGYDQVWFMAGDSAFPPLEATQGSNYLHTGIVDYDQTMVDNLDYVGSLDYAAEANDMPVGEFLINAYNFPKSKYINYAYGQFRANSVTIAAGPVPESGTWIMMIAGMGVLGAALRQRRAEVSFGKVS